MSLARLDALATSEQIVVLARRPDLLRRLWPFERRVDALVAAAFELLAARPAANPTPKELEDFLTGILSLVRRPTDVVTLLACLRTDDARRDFMDRLVWSAVVEADLVAALVADPEVFARLPPDGPWVGHAITRRGSLLLEDEPDRRFEIEELVPLGVDADRVASRALLGAAFDEDRLTPAAVGRLLELFPNDSYLTAAVGRRS